MNRKLLSIFIALIGLTAAVSASDPAWGAGAADQAKELTMESMLTYAIQDEYLARAEYVAIQERFGAQRPFSNIQRAEENHIAWLVDAYKARGITVPRDEAVRYVKLPASLKEAFQAGVDAEIDNIAMYEIFLAHPLLSLPENSGLRSLFIRLRDASKNHLSAFRSGLARY